MIRPGIIRGVIIEWTGYSGGWGRGAVERFAADGDRSAADGIASDRVAIVGTIFGAAIGLTIECEGDYNVHPRYGAQVQIKRAVVSRPGTAEAVALWLGHALPHVGRRRAAALVEHFGSVAELWRVIEHDTERLCELRGITPERAAQIRSAYVEAAAEREDQIALRGFGLTDLQASRCADTFGGPGAAVTAVLRDPYCLIRSVPGFGFKRTDEVALRSGVARNAPARISAGIYHVLAEAYADGHIYMRAGVFSHQVRTLLGLERSDVYPAIMRALRTGDIIKRGPRVYLPQHDADEDELAVHLWSRVYVDNTDRQIATSDAGSD
jgi:ATP-dependent exoDNAse (exonuclease V) alpha subunit